METSASDRELIDAMKRYFAAKAELSALKSALEAARQVTGEEVGAFYDPRKNPGHAADILKSHDLKGEMIAQMGRAEAWSRAPIDAEHKDQSAGITIQDILRPSDA